MEKNNVLGESKLIRVEDLKMKRSTLENCSDFGEGKASLVRKVNNKMGVMTQNVTILLALMGSHDIGKVFVKGEKIIRISARLCLPLATSFTLFLSATSGFSLGTPTSASTTFSHLLESSTTNEPGFHLSLGSSTYGYKSSFQQEFQAHGIGRARGSLGRADAEFFGTIALQPKGTSGFFDVAEGSFGYEHEKGRVSLLVGRHKSIWSELDHEWSLGIWEPRNRWDYLRPIEVGLIGGFLSVNTPLVRAEVFASPIFLPEAGPPSQLENGTFNSNNPWFSPPAPFLSFNQQLVPIRYGMDSFNAMELISKFGASGKVRVGRENSGPYLQLSGAYKPMNQLMLGYDGLLNLASQEANIKLKPAVGYQRLVGVDGGLLNWNRFSQKISVLSETALMPPNTDGYTYRQASNAISYSTQTRYTLNESTSSFLSLGYMRRLGGNTGDKGKDAVAGESIFEDRYTFSSAMKLAVASDLSFMSLGSFFAESDLTYDFIDQSEIFRLKLTYRPQYNLSFMLGTDLLGTQMPAGSYSQSWIRSFNYNDRVYGGVSYVF